MKCPGTNVIAASWRYCYRLDNTSDLATTSNRSGIICHLKAVSRITVLTLLGPSGPRHNRRGGVGVDATHFRPHLRACSLYRHHAAACRPLRCLNIVLQPDHTFFTMRLYNRWVGLSHGPALKGCTALSRPSLSSVYRARLATTCAVTSPSLQPPRLPLFARSVC